MRSQWVALAALALVVPGCGALPSKPLDAVATLSAGRIRVLEYSREIAARQILPYITVYPPCGEQFNVSDGISASFSAYERDDPDDRQPYGWGHRGLIEIEGVRVGWADAYWGQPGGASQAGIAVARVTPDSATIWGYFGGGRAGTLRVRVGLHQYTFEGALVLASSQIPIAQCYSMETEYEARLILCDPPEIQYGDAGEAIIEPLPVKRLMVPERRR